MCQLSQQNEEDDALADIEGPRPGLKVNRQCQKERTLQKLRLEQLLECSDESPQLSQRRWTAQHLRSVISAGPIISMGLLVHYILLLLSYQLKLVGMQKR